MIKSDSESFNLNLFQISSWIFILKVQTQNQQVALGTTNNMWLNQKLKALT